MTAEQMLNLIYMSTLCATMKEYYSMYEYSLELSSTYQTMNEKEKGKVYLDLLKFLGIEENQEKKALLDSLFKSLESLSGSYLQHNIVLKNEIKPIVDKLTVKNDETE